jgi:hypothetical protein
MITATNPFGVQYDCYVTMEMHKLIVRQQYHHVTIATYCYTTWTITSLWKCNITHCYTVGTVSLLWKCCNSLLCNRHCYVTMEMQQTHYTTGTATLPWKCNMVHRSCYQGKPNMSQYIYIYMTLQETTFYTVWSRVYPNTTSKFRNIVIFKSFKQIIIHVKVLGMSVMFYGTKIH